ncbi:VanZ family protein [Niastella caeni]|uniref:VanZ family protein n=1 Tax=Niastella caeni TaxID=2569763 RepID=A0A4S8I3S9_9BACT|nr:VanZ family protein [Niastella caeni]THU40962.1 VanZ family protein [Niastella caeni]
MHSNTNVTKATRYRLEGAGKTALFVVLLTLTGVFCEWPNFHPEHFFGANYHWWLDMVFHGGYYFAITAFLYIVFCKGRYKFLFWLAILLSSCFFEALQSFVPGRSVSLLDLTSNFLGISLATLICSLFYR